MNDLCESIVVDYVLFGRKIFISRVGISLNFVVRFKESDNIVDKGVNFVLVGIGDEVGIVVDIGKFGDLDRFVVSVVVIVNVFFDIVYVVFVDV